MAFLEAIFLGQTGGRFPRSPSAAPGLRGWTLAVPRQDVAHHVGHHLGAALGEVHVGLDHVHVEASRRAAAHTKSLAGIWMDETKQVKLGKKEDDGSALLFAQIAFDGNREGKSS